MSHDHAHHHDHAGPGGRLAVMLAMVVAYMGVEVAGGLWTGSLALLADAGHMFSDAAALAITLVALRVAQRPSSPQRTYGWHRAEVLAAVVNGAALIAISIGILWEAMGRWQTAPEVQGLPMMAVAAGGLVVNAVGLALLAKGREGNMNLRGAWLHVLSDALGSAGALVAGALVWLRGWTWADPAASAFIALLVMHAAWKLVDEALHVLMEGAPPHIDVDDVRASLVATPGVVDVHDLHVWSIHAGLIAMSGHVVVRDADGPELLRTLGGLLRARFGIVHTTIQLEPPDFEGEEGLHP